jgi:tRNA-dihydrouridine synthase B
MFPKLSQKAILSPMSGVTDVAFRALCKQYGAGMTYTEFVSGTALVRGNQKAHDMIRTDPSETPVAVQLFGSSVKDVVQAATTIQDRFDVIDINCGCPAWKVIKTGAGSALLNDPAKISSFINKLVTAIDKPVTIKIRAGIDDKHINAVQVAQLAEGAGAAAVAIHGRTQRQGYRGEADWNIIKKVKDSVSIPVIGNGDVFSPETFKQRLEESGVDAIMIARGAIGNPYLFKQIDDYMKKGKYEPVNQLQSFRDLLKIANRHNLSPKIMKNHALKFTKGIEGGSKLRGKMASCETMEDVIALMDTLE